MAIGVQPQLPEIDAYARLRTSALPEGALIRGYSGGPAPRIEPCACGDVIVAPAEDWDAIALAVRVHNLSTVHQQWAVDQGLRQPGERPTTPPARAGSAGAYGAGAMPVAAAAGPTESRPGASAAALAGGSRSAWAGRQERDR